MVQGRKVQGRNEKGRKARNERNGTDMGKNVSRQEEKAPSANWFSRGCNSRDPHSSPRIQLAWEKPRRVTI